MEWLFFSFLTALFESLKDVLCKKSLEDMDEYIVAWSLRLFCLPFLFPLLLLYPLPVLGKNFWWALMISGLLNVVTAILYMKAIKQSDLSLSVPMLTFTPLFLLITSPFILGEYPTMFGLFGICLIVGGSYILNVRCCRRGIFSPFRTLLKEQGPRLMLMVAFIWSVTANFDKVGIRNSSVSFWIVAVNIFGALAMVPLVMFKGRANIRTVGERWPSLLSIGFINALKFIAQMSAIQIALVAYVISIKRTSAILGVMFGYLFFKEKGIRERLLGTVVMLLGVLLITLS